MKDCDSDATASTKQKRKLDIFAGIKKQLASKQPVDASATLKKERDVGNVDMSDVSFM
jgi:hypothetical protein